jgi:hypothetical protein
MSTQVMETEEKQVIDTGYDVSADSENHTPPDTELVEDELEEEIEEELDEDIEEGEEDSVEDSEEGSEEDQTDDEEDSQPASPIGPTPQEIEDLKRKAIEADVYRELMKTNGGFGEGSGGSPLSANNANPLTVPAKPDETAEAMAAAKKHFEEGDYDGGIAAIQFAMAKHSERNNETIKNVVLNAITPLYQERQQQAVQNSWLSFCQADTDLKAEYEQAIKSPTTKTPLRDAMTEALQSGMAGNWEGALIIAKNRVKTGASQVQQPGVKKKTALAASTMSRPSKAVSTVSTVPRDLPDREYLKQCLAQTDRELSMKKKKR